MCDHILNYLSIASSRRALPQPGGIATDSILKRDFGPPIEIRSRSSDVEAPLHIVVGIGPGIDGDTRFGQNLRDDPRDLSQCVVGTASCVVAAPWQSRSIECPNENACCIIDEHVLPIEIAPVGKMGRLLEERVADHLSYGTAGPPPRPVYPTDTDG